MLSGVQAVQTAVKNVIAIEHREAQAASWNEIAAVAANLKNAGDADPQVVTMLRADLGLPPAS